MSTFFDRFIGYLETLDEDDDVTPKDILVLKSFISKDRKEFMDLSDELNSLLSGNNTLKKQAETLAGKYNTIVNEKNKLAEEYQSKQKELQREIEYEKTVNLF